MADNAQDTCQFCGRQFSDQPTDARFCSVGCKHVANTLGNSSTGRDQPQVSSRHRDDISDTRNDTTRNSPQFDEPEPTATDRRFFHVAGMHSATCERFLEDVACAQAGVHDAEASYVTESIRVDYDPAQCETSDLKAALSTAGYRVVARDKTSGESMAVARQREGASQEARDLEDLLGYRYIVGVIFGSFMLLPYLAVLYPAHLVDLFGRPIGPFDGLTLGSDAVLLAPLFLGVSGAVVFFTGLPLLQGAYVSLRTRRPNTDLLATITILAAFCYSTIALLLGRIDIYFDLAIIVAASVVAAMLFESLVKQEALDSLSDITMSRIDEARLCLPNGTETIDVEDLRSDDRLVVRHGERVPVDGMLDQGTCTVDESVVTGEMLPTTKHAGDEVVGGSLVTDGAAVLRVGDPPTSSIEGLTTAVWHLQSATHGLRRATDRFTERFVPVLFGMAAVIAGLVLLGGGGPVELSLQFLAVLLVACPWVLALATPLSVGCNLRAALDRGIVVFDETVFERLRETDILVLDKTGTLTTGEMEVIDSNGPAELLSAAGVLESYASHPAAHAIAHAFGPAGEGDEDAVASETNVSAFETHGVGVSGEINGETYLVGHPDLFTEQGWTIDSEIQARVETARELGRLPVVLGRSENSETPGVATGVIILGTNTRDGLESFLEGIDDRGIELIVLTGDSEQAAEQFHRNPHISRTFAGIPPSGKTATIEQLRQDHHVTMVGDGTNDAPALAEADLGLSLGSGTALAADAADVAIATDDLHAIETTFELAQAARRRVRENIALALGYNVLLIPAALLGLLNPVLVTAGVVASAGLIGLNSVRAVV